MTTIACTRESIACDSLCHDGNTKCSVTKVWKVGNSYLGIAGSYADCVAFIEWIKDDLPEDEVPDMQNVSALWLRQDGIYQFDSHLMPFKIKDKVAAIGSGAQGALVALHLGHSPKDAVKASAKVDPNTGGRVKEYKLAHN